MSPPDADVAELPSSPGARLRSAREAQGISHQQAAESLNLDTMVLARGEQCKSASFKPFPEIEKLTR